jgi:hypothetical protein
MIQAQSTATDTDQCNEYDEPFDPVIGERIAQFILSYSVTWTASLLTY